RAALRWACDGGDHTIGLRLAGALRKFWQSRGLISEGRAWLAALLARADTTAEAAETAARLQATQAAAWLASNPHDFTQAATLFEECVELHRALGDREGIAQVQLALGDIARDQGDVAQMRRYAEQSLQVFRELGVQWAIGFALNNLALAASLEGDLTHALSLV